MRCHRRSRNDASNDLVIAVARKPICLWCVPLEGTLTRDGDIIIVAVAQMNIVITVHVTHSW